MYTRFTKYYYLLLVLLFTNCATQKAKYATVFNEEGVVNKDIVHTFYLIGDAGLSPIGGMNPVLKQFKKQLNLANKNSTAIFLGDNIYPAGMPSKEESLKENKAAKNHLDAQMSTVSNFKGKTIFIPGNHDWYSNGLEGLKREQKYIEKQLDSKKVFYPDSGCPIAKIDIDDKVVVIAIDTEWYLTNWDKHPKINDNCEIKSRDKFFEEIEGLIKKNASKTTVIALHHPMFTYGVHGGQYSLKQQLFPSHSKIPLPVLGSVINLLRKTTGASTTDMQNKRYQQLKKRLVTLAQYSERVIFASGHEHSLQYIVEENTPQIVSGSGAKKGATRLLNGSQFSSGGMGYATLKIYTDGSSSVDFYELDADENKKLVFTSQVLAPKSKHESKNYNNNFPATVKASIYTQEEIEKSNFFKTIWGERYRKYYGVKVTAPTVGLDTLFGGLEPLRKGGGHQSKSLRLTTKGGKEYVMRALRKSAELYLQSMAFKEQYIVGEFQDTYTESLLSDFYTGAHPYAPFVMGELSNAINIFHTNPVLYYVPKQKTLKGFNSDFGDELYMIEERVTNGHEDQKSFGYASKIESTDDLFKKLRKDEKYKIDAQTYLRARLFDMAVGDWDRHVDQWRWAAFKAVETGDMYYKPIPRDRDQAFSRMGDGALMNLATRIVPALRLMEGFDDEIRNVKGFNSSPLTHALDMLALKETTLEQWKAQATYIQKNLTPEVINKAFANFPKEVRSASFSEIKKVFMERLETLEEVAEEYYSILNKYAVVTGTDKDDWFTINHLGNGETDVKGYRIKNGERGKLFFHKRFDNRYTKEIWIYGLDDDDYYYVNGENKNNIKLRLIGGQNNDVYDIAIGKKVHIYDQKNAKNTIKNRDNAKLAFTNDYETNTYRPLKYRSSVNQLIPTVGSNPDDGFKIGLSNVYTYNGFRKNPFTQQHTVSGAFYFVTSGFDFSYKGEFAHVFGNANLELEAKFTSPNFSRNFFDLGNETPNEDENLGMDYNRVRLEQMKLSPSLVWRGAMGSKFKVGVLFETIQVEETVNRFVNTFYVQNDEEIRNSFLGVDANYSYENKDNNAFPTMGMTTSLQLGYKANIDRTTQNFAYVIPSLGFNYKLVSDGRLVLATKWKAHFNIGDGFEFYQAANIGAADGPRSYRNERFSGKKMYYQNTDIRYSLRKVKTGLLPLAMGLYSGFDYGKVWLPGEDSDKWHTSYGGGFFLNGADIVTANFSLFYGDEGARFAFGLGFGF